MTEEDLLNVRNFGRKSLDELRDRLILKNFITPERAQEQFGGAYREDYEFEEDEE
jgi:DNA-directed RNA polymerase alpha subunit